MSYRDGTLTGDEARRRLHEETVRDAPLAERIDEVLEIGRSYLDVESAHVAEIDVETGQWEAIASTDPPDGTIPEGHTRELANSYCRHVVQRESPFAVHDVAEHGLEDDPAYERTELGCYHGAAISVDDELYGTICFASEDPRASPFTDEEKLFVDLAGTLLGHAIQRARHDRRLSEQRAELARQREQFRSLLSANFDVVLRLDRDGTIRQLTESDREVLGYSDGDLVGTNYAALMATQASFEKATAAIDRVLDGEPVEELSLDVLSCDDEAVLVDLRAAPIYEPRGRPEDVEPLDAPSVGASADHGSEPTDADSASERHVGAIHVVLRDATQRQRYQHLVSVLQRVLRHNVRNALNVIYGSTDELADSVAGDPDQVETIKQTCAELLSLSEKAGRLESAVGEPESPVTVSLAAVARRVADRVGDRYPDAELSVAADGAGYARGNYGLEQAVEEVVENAAKHGGEAPTVSVTVEAGEDEVVLEVADDGPGLPEQESGVLTSGEETPLEHGSGLGHWFVYWIVTSLDGTVEADCTGSGTVVTLTVPAAPSDDPSDALLDSA